MVSIANIQKGLAAYLDNEVLPQFPSNGLERVLAGTAIGLGIRKSGSIIMGYKDHKAVQMLEIMDADGNVDVNVLAEELKKNVPVDGVKIDVPMIGGMTFHKEDVDKLKEYIISQ